jgi:hypothetical protein
MTLSELANGGGPIPLALIGADNVLTKEIQTRLGEIGLLDPPADGSFGPVSLWATAQFLRKAGQGNVASFNADAAKLLMSADAEKLFPLNETTTFAGQIVSAMTQEGHWICRHPDCVNIVYVEGMDVDGSINTDAPNVFNDLRAVVRINRAGNPEIVGLWEATTEPGIHHTKIEILDPRGAARIALGQFKAWSIGVHMAGRPSAHEALVQTASIKVHRDLNQDFEREEDAVFEGLFGINQHWGFDLPKSDIGRASAGCLVGRTKSGHRAFIALCKQDPRYVANNSYRFMTSVLPAKLVDDVS